MASAAKRGDVVYTSDFTDLQRLQAAFPRAGPFRLNEQSVRTFLLEFRPPCAPS
jgi:hypothetical protein